MKVLASHEKGIVLSGPDTVIEGRARAAGLDLRLAQGPDDFDISFGKTLFVEAGTRVPWDLLPAAWHFLERWDAAAPLWRYGETAEMLGTAEERRLTAAVVRDLRVLVHSVELLFVRNTEQGRGLMAAWVAEMGREGVEDRRLAFLRALYLVKPRLCVLPRSWLAEVQAFDRQVGGGRVQQRPSLNAGKRLVSVELEPGRFVKCHEGDEERVRAGFERQRMGRRG